MKYLNKQDIVSSYQRFQNSMKNKSWGFLALLKECGSVVQAATPYQINLDNVSNFLENIFNLSDSKKTYTSGKSLYVVFSKQWKNFFKAQGRSTPNLFDVAIWTFRRESFEDSATSNDLLVKFVREFNIPRDVISTCFDITPRDISFANNACSESEIKDLLHNLDVDVSKSNIDAERKSVVANPGEISRGPFVQPLYTGLEITDYVILLQSDYNENYGEGVNSYNMLHDGINSIDVQYKLFLHALQTKPFLLLAGISGTGKSRKVRELAFKSCPEYLRDADGTTPGNYCMIEVKPNWHDSSEILGYYSSIASEYRFTKFVKFLVKATLHPDVPFFVCLDEMNLAPVEQYFAEILSVLETRKRVGKHIKTGIIVDGKYFKSAGKTKQCTDNREVYMKLQETTSEHVNEEVANSHSLIEKGLTLPDNVFIVGTVNMDDTTHQFSRKVIDRAMTIEMNGEDLSKMFETFDDLKYLDEKDVWPLEKFASKYVTADEALDEHQAEANDIKQKLIGRLKAINDILNGTPFVVSYRVLNELCIYTVVLLEDGMSLDYAINTAVDQITLMKILPRIEGDEDMFAVKDNDNNRLVQLKNLFAAESDSYKKLDEMNERLVNCGFTRFWP